MTTELLALDEIIQSQASKEITHNTALRQIEGRTVRALDKDLTTPPGSPAAGDTYIIPSGAIGVWSGKTNQIAHFYGGGGPIGRPSRACGSGSTMRIPSMPTTGRTGSPIRL